jgi:hypothetical protein
MAFVKFTEVGKNFVPQAIMWPSGVITLNQGARKKFGLDIYSHVVMYMNPDDHTIAFEFVHDENLEGANRVRRLRDHVLDVNARPFLNHFKLRVKRPLSFRLDVDTKTGWVMLALDQGQVMDGADQKSQKPEAQKPVLQAVKADDQERRLNDVGRTAAAAALKTLAGTVPANGDDHAEKQNVQKDVRVAAVGAATHAAGAQNERRSRGVKAILSEFLQDS